MSSSHSAAVHLVPLIARVVLCAAFLPMGYQKLFDRTELTAAEATALDAMGWGWRPPAIVTLAPAAATDAPIGTAPGSAVENGATGAEVLNAPNAPNAANAPNATTTVVMSEPRSVRNCEKLAFTIANAGLPAPRVTAWLVAIIEFLGGALILIGLFSRLSALGLAAVMAGAIYTTSLVALKTHPFIYGMPLPDYKTLFLQVGLMALALGVLLAGPGGLSLDSVIFGRARKRAAPPRHGAGGS